MQIDIHVHTTRMDSITRANGETWASPEELLEIMDRIGTTQAVLLPLVSPEGMHQPILSEEMLSVVQEYPDRFIPFCNVDPRADSNSPDSRLRAFVEHYVERGCKGVGEITANIPMDDPRVDNLFEACQAVGVPVLFHIGPQASGCYGLIDDLGLPRLERALQRFPALRFIGHSQPFWAEMGPDCSLENRNTYPNGPVSPGGRLPQLFTRYPNLYGDLSAGSGYNAVSRDLEFGAWFMEEHQDRLMFGTDICAPSNSTPLVTYLRECREQGSLSAQAYEKITWRNANQLLQLG